MPNEVTPTQADRDFAADNISGPLRDCIRSGGMDRYPLVKAAAVHRIAHEAPLLARNAELEAVIAAVRVFAKRQRGASKLVGPYPDKPQLHREWVRTLYHEGRALLNILKPALATKDASHDA